MQSEQVCHVNTTVSVYCYSTVEVNVIRNVGLGVTCCMGYVSVLDQLNSGVRASHAALLKQLQHIQHFRFTGQYRQ